MCSVGCFGGRTWGVLEAVGAFGYPQEDGRFLLVGDVGSIWKQQSEPSKLSSLSYKLDADDMWNSMNSNSEIHTVHDGEYIGEQ